MYIKHCNTCKKDILYTNRCSFRWAIRNCSDCKKCSALKRPPKNEETRRKISKTLTGRKIPVEVKLKIQNTLKQKFNTPEYKKKFSIQNSKINNPMYGKHHSEESKKKMSINTKQAMNTEEMKEKMERIQNSKEYKEKVSKALTGKIRSETSKQRYREMVVRRVQKYGILSRNFNPKACLIIDDYGKQNGYNFQHALNGGEFHVKGLGYLVDGYDKDKNTVIEIDEKQHFDFSGNLKEKDIRRQKEITNHLKCEFIRLLFNEERHPCTT